MPPIRQTQKTPEPTRRKPRPKPVRFTDWASI
jgi:hypothetical protein